MASIVKKTISTGTRYYIQLSQCESKDRPKITLQGNIPKKDAETARRHIENLIGLRDSGGEMSTATKEWLNGISDNLKSRLESLGFVECQTKSKWTVAAWVADYIAKRPDVKEATRRKWRDVESKLAAFFKDDSVGAVTVQAAKAFRVYLQTTAGLSENTLRRHIGIARQFFNAAVDAEIITKNPFRGQSVSVRANDSRFFYVPVETARAVLGACPDAEWRLLFGLARFGGLRCPSEVLTLKWQDIDFERQRFTVHSSKTEHHADGGVRIVPMFQELKPLFQDAFDNAKEGAVYCISKYNGQWSNVGVHMARIIKRAGVDIWPKLFQNCRSTRETELFKKTGGNIKAVCTWLGNSPAVAMEHYAQITEADMREATKNVVLNQAEEGVQNREHPTAESSGIDRNEQKEEIAISAGNSGFNGENADFQNANHWAIRDLNPGPAD